ncbi:MAG: ATP-grasp domain-containing protein [Gammaproteobacteria bacterium]
MSEPGKYVLTIASSGRMLAESARRAGFRPLVVDLFGDEDARLAAEELRVVRRFDSMQCRSAVAEWLERYPVEGAVYGSGLESQAGFLAWLSQRLPIFGNPPSVMQAVQDKKVFFAKLGGMGAPFPETRFAPPKDEEGWLVKPFFGQGGCGIFRHETANGAGGEDIYWQRHVGGRAMSVLFMADGRRSRLIGFNEQWTEQLDPDLSFCFSGVLNRAELTAVQKAEIGGWVRKISAEFALKGLNGLDFIAGPDHCYLLEVNPRPPASMMLYDPDFPEGLFQAHVVACREGLDRIESPASFAARGVRILYAREEATVPEDVRWPAWAQDRPAAGSTIRRLQPICSIMAVEKNALRVAPVLRQRADTIYKLLNIKG